MWWLVLIVALLGGGCMPRECYEGQVCHAKFRFGYFLEICRGACDPEPPPPPKPRLDQGQP